MDQATLNALMAADEAINGPDPSAPTREVTRLRRDSFTGIPGQAPIPRTETVPNYPENVGERVLAGAHDLANTAGDTLSMGMADRAQAAMTGEPLEAVRARTAASRARDPGQAVVGDLMAAGVGGAGAAKAGVTMMRPGAGALLSPILAAAEAGTYGAVNGAGHSKGDLLSAQAAQDALREGKTGALIGGGIPILAQGARATAQAVKDFLGRDAQQTLSRLVSPRALEQLDQLGPEGRLLDARGGRMVAQGIHMRGDDNAEALGEVLDTRFAGRDARTRAAVTENFGPNVDPTILKEGIDANIGKYAGVAYPQAKAGMGTIEGVGAVIDDLGASAQKLSADARPVMVKHIDNIRDAVTGNTPEVAAQRLHDIRKRLDKQLEGTFDTAADRADRGVLQTVRDKVDGLLKRSPDFAAADARVADMNRQKEGVDLGFEALDRSLVNSPAVYQQNLNKNGKRVAAALGMRGRMEAGIGNNSNDTAEMRRLLGGDDDWNRAKIGMTFPERPEAVPNMVRHLDSEARFDASRQAISGGSQTAQRLGADKTLGDRAVNIPVNPLEIPGRVVNKVANALVGGALNRGGDAFRSELTRALTASGPERDRVVQGLLARAQERSAGGQAARDALADPTIARLIVEYAP